MSDQNSDLSAITQFCCHGVSINWFNVNLLRNNNWLGQKEAIVNRHKKLNSHLSITMVQDQCSSDLKYSDGKHCCLLMIFSRFNQKYGQVLKLNMQFSVNMIVALLHNINITITKYFFASHICNMVCYVLYTTRGCGGHTASSAKRCCLVINDTKSTKQK